MKTLMDDYLRIVTFAFFLAVIFFIVPQGLSSRLDFEFFGALILGAMSPIVGYLIVKPWVEYAFDRIIELLNNGKDRDTK